MSKTTKEIRDGFFEGDTSRGIWYSQSEVDAIEERAFNQAHKWEQERMVSLREKLKTILCLSDIGVDNTCDVCKQIDSVFSEFNSETLNDSEVVDSVLKGDLK